MTAVIVSTIAFFVAAFLLKRQIERMDLPEGMTSNTLVFALALLVSYFVATLVDWAVAH
jgi:hypothetical protein